eukprot:7209836-Pyramimonas_sp.AAC.1
MPSNAVPKLSWDCLAKAHLGLEPRQHAVHFAFCRQRGAAILPATHGQAVRRQRAAGGQHLASRRRVAVS